MSKVLIVSVSAGAGHVRAANAVEAYLNSCGYEVKNVDLMTYSKKWFKHIYADKYIDLINNHPNLWKFLFELTDKPVSKPLYKTRRWLEYKLHKKFFQMIEDFKPDHVISTHFMPPEILLRFKEKKNLNFDISVVVTDFDVHYLWLHNNIKQYFVGGELAKNKLIKLGVNEKNITISGIPIMPQFFNSFNKQKLLEKWNLDSDKKTLLLMAGGAGIGSLDSISHEILSSINDVQIIALPGKNKELFDKLKKLEDKFGCRLKTIGFTNEVHELMFLSDLVVTKPGGLSTSECIALKKPMLLINPIPGQEEFNAKNIEQRHLGKLSTDIINDIKFMLNDLDKFTQQYQQENKHNTEEIISSYFKE